MVDPVGRFLPAPGLTVDRTIKSVAISGNLELFGAEATPARALQVQNSINTNWTQSFPDGYSVKCNVVVQYRGPGSNPGAATQIQARIMTGPSETKMSSPREMYLNATENDAFTWTPAHEFGHIMGMDDRYSESIMSRIRGELGGARSATTQPGYSGNLMAEVGGVLSSQNVADLATENQPSPFWINDDDQVRAWVIAHSLLEINALSAADKLAAIGTLMSGWISDDDMIAIGRICQSVTDHAQSRSIRDGVDLLDFSSIGQRTQMRVFLSRMP